MIENYAIQRNIPIRQKWYGLAKKVSIDPNLDMVFPDSSPDIDLQVLATWLSDQKFNLVGGYEYLVDRMKHGDVLEAYNLAGELMFGNSHFHRKTSQFMEVRLESWKKLYERDPKYTMKCNAVLMRLIASTSEKPVDLTQSLGRTTLKEIGGDKYTIDYNPQLAQKIIDKHGLPVGVLVLTEASVI